MLVSLTDNDLRPTAYGGDVTSSSGYDIIFRALDDTTCGGSGTAPCTLDHEIEFYDGTPDDVTLSGGWYTGTGSYTVPAGRNRLLVFVTGFENTADRDVTNVTFGGVSMVEAVGNVVSSGGYYARTEIWYLKDASIPASGSFVVTYSGGAPTNPMHAYALFTNVDQTTPIENTASNPTTTLDPVTATVNVVQDGMSIAGATCGNNGSYTWGNGWTEGTDQTSGATTTMSTAHHQNSASGTDTASANHSSTINRQVLVVASLRPAGELVAWVRVPSITNGTVIYIYYGNGCITSPTENPTGVWNTNYKGVWHLKETSGTQYDSTQYGNNGTASVTTQGSATGKIDGADTFSGTTDRVQVGTSNWSATYGTLELWGYQTSRTATHYFFGHTTLPAFNNRIQLYTDDTAGNLDLGLGSSHTARTNIQTLTLNTWYHIVLTWNAGNYIVYVNGVSTASGSYAGLSTLGTFADIGNDGDTATRNEAFHGIIDEVRISSTVRSAGWIQTEYNNQNAPSSFYSIGSETSPAPTAVLLSSFTGTEYEGKVLLQWKTGYEANNLGFNVYREEDGQLTQVNSELISGGAFLAGANRATAGHSYAWLDILPDATDSIQYWLEDIDLSGKRTMNGPVTPDISMEPLPEKAQAALMSQLSRGQSEKDKIASRLWALKTRLGRTQQPATSYQLSAINPRSPVRPRSTELVVSGVDTGSKEGTLPSSPLNLSDRPGQTVSLPSGQQKKLTPQEVQWVLAGSPGLKLFIQEEGWYRVTQPELVAAGLDPRVNPCLF